jgi:hypothetical protein
MSEQTTSSRFVCRFAAGDQSGRLSGEWRIWSAKKQPDLYVAIRYLGQIKAAVHCPRIDKPTWRRHYGFDRNATGEVAEADRARGVSRHKGTWNGAELGKYCTLEFKIFIPAAALNRSGLPASENTVLIPPPRGDQSLVVAVILGPTMPTTGYPRMQDAETHLLTQGRLCDGRRVWIIYAYTLVTLPTSPNQIQMNLPSDISPEALRAAAAQGSLRAFAIIKNEDGSLGLLDGRVDHGGLSASTFPT